MVVPVIALYICIHLLEIVDASYENYIILPENSEVCLKDPAYRRFYLSRQMSFATGAYNSSLNNLIYACKVRIHPNGRLLQYTYPEGHTAYWLHRVLVNISFTSCDDYLTIEFLPEDTTQPMLDPEVVNVTCRSSLPKVFDSKHRIVAFVWHTAEDNVELASSLDIQLSAYMRFEGRFSVADKKRRCESGSGFWCGNETAVCIYGQMRCDQADGCFDGGSDELGCPPPRNYSHLSVDPRRSHSTWLSYLPWTALGLIPLMLVFVLGLICSPRRSLDDDLEDDDEGNIDSDVAIDSKTKTSSASPPESPDCSSTCSSSSSPRDPRSIGSFPSLPRGGELVLGDDRSLLRSNSQPRLEASPPLQPKVLVDGLEPGGKRSPMDRSRKSLTARVVTFQLPAHEADCADPRGYAQPALEMKPLGMTARTASSAHLSERRSSEENPSKAGDADALSGKRITRQIGFILPSELLSGCNPADNIGYAHHPLETGSPPTAPGSIPLHQHHQQSRCTNDSLPSDDLVLRSSLPTGSDIGFVLPAHFEAAAIRMANNQSAENSLKFVGNAVGLSTAATTVSQLNHKKRPSASSLAGEKTLEEDQVTLLTSTDTPENASSTSSESYREDVAPFRRPDVPPSNRNLPQPESRSGQYSSVCLEDGSS